MTQLSAHFALEEFMTPKVRTDYPVALIDAHLMPLVDRLEWIRDLVGVPGKITNAYRTAADNAAVGGAADSQHLDGDAADVVFLLVPLRRLALLIQASIDNGSSPGFGQLIVYKDKGHVHVSNPADRLGDRNGRALYSPGLADDGTRVYTPLADAVASSAVATLSDPQTREGLLASSSSSFSPSSSPRSSAGAGAAPGKVRHE